MRPLPEELPPEEHGASRSWLGPVLTIALVANAVLSVFLLSQSLNRDRVNANQLALLAADAQRRLQDASNQLAKVEGQRTEIESKSNKAEEVLASLVKEVEDLQKKSSESKAHFEKQLEQGQSAVQQLNHDLAELRHKSEQAEAVLLELHARQQTKSDELEKIIRASEEAQQRLNSLEAKSREARLAAEKSAEELALIQQKLDQARETNAQIIHQRDQLNSAMATEESKLEDVRREYAERQVQALSALNELKQAKTLLEEAQKSVRDLTMAKKALACEITTATDRITQLRLARERLERDVSRLELRHQELDPTEAR